MDGAWDGAAGDLHGVPKQSVGRQWIIYNQLHINVYKKRIFDHLLCPVFKQLLYVHYCKSEDLLWNLDMTKY